MDLKEFIDKSVTSKIAIKELKQRDPDVKLYASASGCVNSELGVLYVNSSKLSLIDLDSVMSIYNTG